MGRPGLCGLTESEDVALDAHAHGPWIGHYQSSMSAERCRPGIVRIRPTIMAQLPQVPDDAFRVGAQALEQLGQAHEQVENIARPQDTVLAQDQKLMTC